MRKVFHTLLTITTGADIDTLCIVPIHVSRQDFFGPFFEELKGMNDVTEITRVPEAYVPIMKLIFDGISVWSFDLVYNFAFRLTCCFVDYILKRFQII